ncbi:hypothetical protein C2845_PM17G02690 [Panicum miliaceum]|uniref:Uncharacterized protein n=1 Tax=Panicum miliaceum TaxID=4540 RepID=A0A3L6Q5C2_PANMI|nr:hypothetical protein C2845_PM17G02690 [Panicum miliaceum]
MLLQWGQNKRSCGRWDSASGSGALPQRRAGAKIQRRSPTRAPPSGLSYTRGSNLRTASPLPPRSGSGIGTSDAHHSRGREKNRGRRKGPQFLPFFNPPNVSLTSGSHALWFSSSWSTEKDAAGQHTDADALARCSCIRVAAEELLGKLRQNGLPGAMGRLRGEGGKGETAGTRRRSGEPLREAEAAFLAVPGVDGVSDTVRVDKSDAGGCGADARCSAGTGEAERGEGCMWRALEAPAALPTAPSAVRQIGAASFPWKEPTPSTDQRRAGRRQSNGDAAGPGELSAAGLRLRGGAAGRGERLRGSRRAAEQRLSMPGASASGAREEASEKLHAGAVAASGAYIEGKG